MMTILEVLPTEIFFEIFDYLNIFDIFYGFINLNQRLNEILNLYPIELDFQYISRSKFDFICRYIHPKQVISIYLSDELMPNQIELFHQHFLNFHSRFIHLKKLQFINTSTILPHLPLSITSLSIKTYLKTNNTDYLITQILNQQSQYLKYLQLDGCYAFRSIDISFPLLTHLIIDYCTITEFHRILHSIKSPLIYLKLFLDKEENNFILDFKQLSNTLTHLILIFSDEIIISFDLIKQYIQPLFKLLYLTIRATGTFDLINGTLWEEYLLEKTLKKFHFKFTLANIYLCHQDKNSLLQSFRSSFWIEKHHWYVACEKGQLQTSRPVIYSIPYFQSPIIFYPTNHFLPISTNQNEILFSKHTTHLILTFHQTIILPESPFHHISSLTLLTSTLPSIEILQSIVNLTKIEELDVSLVKYLFIDDFQTLIDSMNNLKTIKMQYNPLYNPPLHINSYIFVRKDKELSVINSNNLQRFCYLFFHIKYLEITVQSKDIIIQLLNQLHYLEQIKIFCYQDYLRNTKSNWFLENIPRLNTISFTYRITSSCLFLSIGDRKIINDQPIVLNTKRKTVHWDCFKSRSRCILQ